MAENTEKLKQTDKWCPLARLPVVHGPACSANRFPGGVAHSDDWKHVRCLAECCGVYNAGAGRCGLIG